MAGQARASSSVRACEKGSSEIALELSIPKAMIAQRQCERPFDATSTDSTKVKLRSGLPVDKHFKSS